MTQDYERNTTISAALTVYNADDSSSNASLTTTISSITNADECSNTNINTPAVDVTRADSALKNNAETVLNNLDVSINNDGAATTSVKSSTTNAELTESDGLAREKFVRFLLAMNKKPIELNLYENTKVKGFFKAADTSFRNIAVSQLVTPIAVYDSATIRTSDIMTISVSLLDMS